MTCSAVTCENPLLNQSLNILDYEEPAILGTTVSFTCSQPEEVLIGSNTVTCMDDGEWVPDPSQLKMKCKGMHGVGYH